MKNEHINGSKKYRYISLIICAAFFIGVLSGVFCAYGSMTYRARAAYDDEELVTFGTYATAAEKEYFLSVMIPLVVWDMAENKILASLTLGQAILETGWGISMLARTCNNMFGIKATPAWQGKVFNASTKEIYDNYELAKAHSGTVWKVYDSWRDSVIAHSELFNTADRYKNIRGNFDYKFCAYELINAGYATKTEYAEELIYVIERYELTKYDEQAMQYLGMSTVPSLPEFTGTTYAQETSSTFASSAEGDTTTTEYEQVTGPTKVPKEFIPGEKQEFLDVIGGYASADMRNNHILASFSIAQAIYHSNWGKSSVATKANNIFGIKAYSTWKGKVYNSDTGMVYGSYAEASKKSGSLWRAYDSIKDSFDDRSTMFHGERYKNLVDNYDYVSCCTLVVEDGYIESTTYTAELISYIVDFELTRYDVKEYNNYTVLGNGRICGVKCCTTPEEFMNAAGDIGNSLTLAVVKGDFVGTGSVLADGNDIKYVIIVQGDVDGDGEITVSDFILIKRCCLRLTEFDGAYFDAADFDGNGKIDSTDYLNIRKSMLALA